MRPSLITPSLMYQRSAPRGAPTCISSSRSHMYLTGRPVSIAPRIARGSWMLSTLPPKPPPTVPPMKCRRLEGMFSTFDAVPSEKNSACVEV